MTQLLILGLGNVICADDGVGVAATMQLLRQYRPPRGVRVLDGGTLGLALLPELLRAEAAILIDAIRADGPPGTLVRLEQDGVAKGVATRLSVHQLGISDLLDGASLLGRCPRKLVLCGVIPETDELRFGLSPSVAAAIPALIASVVREAAALGKRFQERRHATRGPDDRLHRYYGL